MRLEPTLIEALRLMPWATVREHENKARCRACSQEVFVPAFEGYDPDTAELTRRVERHKRAHLAGLDRHAAGCPVRAIGEFVLAHDALEAEEAQLPEPEPEAAPEIPHGRVAMHFIGWLRLHKDRRIISGDEDGDDIDIDDCVAEYMDDLGEAAPPHAYGNLLVPEYEAGGRRKRLT